MEQLVGLNCINCQRKITSIMDATFCPECGKAVHTNCMKPVQECTQNCPTCGGDFATATKRIVRSKELAAFQPEEKQPPEPIGPIPVSRVCPKCEEAGFTSIRPKRLVAFTWDRICKSCGTHYTPPTPMWAAATFIGAGIILVLVAVVFGLVSLAARDYIFLAILGFLGLLGILSVAHGYRSLDRPGEV